MLTKIAESAHHSRLTVATLVSLVYIAGALGLIWKRADR